MSSRHTCLLAAALWAMLIASPALAQDLSPADIMQRALDRNAMGFSAGKAQLTLTIKDAAGAERQRSVEVKSKRIDGMLRTLVTLTAPKEVRGQAFLFAEQNGEDDVWMYLPAFKVTRRVEGGQKNGSFLGSHFTYADLESRDMKDAKYEKLPDDKVLKDDVYVIKSIPATGTKSEYAHVISFIRKTDFIPLKIQFFGRTQSAKPDKTLFVEKVDQTTDGASYAKQVTLSVSAGGFTRMQVESLDSADLPDAVFARDQLGK